MMKKIFAIVLALTLVLSLAACDLSPDVRGDVNPKPAGATTAEDEPELSVGSSTSNTYKNEFIGIQCTLDSEWTFKTDAEIQEINKTTAGMMGDDYKDVITNMAVIQDMMATHSNQMDTVNVVLEKLSGINALISEEQYCNLSKDATVQALASMGMNITSSEVVKIQFAGEEHAAITIAGDYAGLAIYECVVAVKCNGYIACVSVATWMENNCQEILNQFTPC